MKFLTIIFLFANTFTFSIINSNNLATKIPKTKLGYYFNDTTLVFVKGGSFKMGNGKYLTEKHKVILDDFYIGKNEVTNTEFVEFLNAIGASPDGSMGRTQYIGIGYRNWNGEVLLCPTCKKNLRRYMQRNILRL